MRCTQNVLKEDNTKKPPASEADLSHVSSRIFSNVSNIAKNNKYINYRI